MVEGVLLGQTTQGESAAGKLSDRGAGGRRAGTTIATLLKLPSKRQTGSVQRYDTWQFIAALVEGRCRWHCTRHTQGLQGRRSGWNAVHRYQLSFSRGDQLQTLQYTQKGR